ncbi:MAG: MgtC/SapB family protein [Planctomycetota bacterium]|nr:MgtC/SapB family protein [Planctomycetota bacterium]
MLSTTDVLFRIGLAFMAGVIVGLDRETHGRAAGLRTTTLVCVAAALGMILSAQLTALCAPAAATWRPDPGRIAAGMLTGMGFLGAGSIMRQENVLRGVTTAAMLWFVTVLGLAFGSGEILLGLIGLCVALIALVIMPFFEKRLKSDWYGHLTVTAEAGALSEDAIKQQLESMDVRVHGLDLDYDMQQKRHTMVFEIQVRPAEVFKIAERVVQYFAQQPGILEVKWV